MKSLLFLILITFALPAIQVGAVELIDQPLFTDDRIYTIELKALPEPGENALSLNIVVTGAEIQDYFLYNETNWLTYIPECSNGKSFTANSICLTLVKSEEIGQSESLGFITLRVIDITKLSIYKINGTKYSDGITVRDDVGELVLATSKSTIDRTIASTPIYGEQDPIVFYLIVGVFFVIVIIIAGLLIKFLRPNKATTLNI